MSKKGEDKEQSRQAWIYTTYTASNNKTENHQTFPKVDDAM